MAESPAKILVWDPLLRAFHWTLVVSIVAAWLSAQVNETLHEIFGYVAVALIAWRVLWGLVGPRYARFSQFVREPRVVWGYLRSILAGTEARFVGHNPAGGFMILALLTVVGVVSASGWLLTTDAVWGNAWAQHAHSLLAHGLVVLIALHIVGVALSSWRHRENLAAAMVTGVKRGPQSEDIL
jgi:cytochrome b